MIKFIGIFQIILLIFAIISFKKESKEYDLKFKKTLFIFLIIMFLGIVGTLFF